MADDENEIAEKTTDTFERTFNTIVGGLGKLSHLVEGGASHTLLLSGVGVLVASLAIKVITILPSVMSKNPVFSSSDLGILVGSAVVLLLLGSGLRVWDRYLNDKADERAIRLRMDAADKASAVSQKAADIRMKAAERLEEPVKVPKPYIPPIKKDTKPL